MLRAWRRARTKQHQRTRFKNIAALHETHHQSLMQDSGTRVISVRWRSRARLGAPQSSCGMVGKMALCA